MLALKHAIALCLRLNTGSLSSQAMDGLGEAIIAAQENAAGVQVLVQSWVAL